MCITSSYLLTYFDNACDYLQRISCTSTIFCFRRNKLNLTKFPLQAADLTKPVDKKMYKGTNPTCHDFNVVTMTPDSVSLVVGFSTGQIQLIDPIKKELSKLYNEEVIVLLIGSCGRV